MAFDPNTGARLVETFLRARRNRLDEYDDEDRRAREEQEYAYKIGQRRKQDAAYESLAASLEQPQEQPPSMLRAAATPSPDVSMGSPFQPPRPLVKKPEGYSYPQGFKGPRSALSPSRIDATADAIAEAYTPRVPPELAALLRADRSTGAQLYAEIVKARAGAPEKIYTARQAEEQKTYSRGRDTVADKKDEREFGLRQGDSRRAADAAKFNRALQEKQEARAAAGFETPGQKRFGDTTADLVKKGGERILGMLFPSAGENIAATNAATRVGEGKANRESREKIAKMAQETARARQEMENARVNAKSENDFRMRAWEIRERGIANLIKTGDIGPTEAGQYFDADVQPGTFSDTIIPTRQQPQPVMVPTSGAQPGPSPRPSQPPQALPPDVAEAVKTLADLKAERDRRRGRGGK